MSSDTPNDRFVSLESLIAHLQHELEQMHEVLLAQQGEMDSLRRDVKRLESRLAQVDEEPESREPLDERPPHY